MSLTTILTTIATLVISALAAWAAGRRTLPSRGAKTFVITATALTAIGNAWYAIWRHLHYESHAFDLGIFDQAVWHLSRLETPASTIRGLSNLLGDHFHPILILLAPWYRFMPSPIVLLVAQALLFASLLPLAYLLARKLKIAAWPAAILAFAFGLNPGLTPALGFDFHEIAFAVPLLVLAFLMFEQRRWTWYWALIALALLTKESMAVYVAAIGVILLRRSTWRIGLTTVAVAAVWYLMATRLVIPALSDTHTFGYWDQYAHLAPTPQALSIRLIAHPWTFFHELFNASEKVKTNELVFASFGFLPLLSWTTLPLVFITLAERFWPANPPLWIYQFHYQVLMVVVLAVATLYALRDWQRWIRLRLNLSAGAAVLVLAMTIWVHTKTASIRILWNQEVRHRPVATWNQGLGAIPRDASVAAQDAFVPHLSERPRIYRLPVINDADYIVLDPRAPGFPLSADEISAMQTKLQSDPAWAPVQQQASFTVFRRVR